MINIFLKVLTIFIFILAGYILKRMRIINENVEKKISFLSFNLLLPTAVALNIIFSDFSIIDIHFLSTFFISGIIILISSFLIGKYIFGLNGNDSSVFGFSASYGNLVSIGIPIIFAVIGPENSIPFILLAVSQGIIFIPLTEFLIHQLGDNRGNLTNLFKGVFFNSLIIGSFLGFILHYSNVPIHPYLKTFLIPITVFSLPSILMSIGMTIAGIKISYDLQKIYILTIIKNIIFPLITFINAKYLFHLNPNLTFMVTIAAALPSGIQTYYMSYRYNSLMTIIPTNVILSTLFSAVSLSILLMLFGY